MLSACNISLYTYGTYHMRTIIPYAYGIKYAYGTEQQRFEGEENFEAYNYLSKLRYTLITINYERNYE